MKYCLRAVGTSEESFLCIAAPLGKGYEIVLFDTPQGAASFAEWYENEHGRKLACFPWVDGGPVR